MNEIEQMIDDIYTLRVDIEAFPAIGCQDIPLLNERQLQIVNLLEQLLRRTDKCVTTSLED